MSYTLCFDCSHLLKFCFSLGLWLNNNYSAPILVTNKILRDGSVAMRKPAFAYAKTKAQISFAVSAKLISAFVFATRILSTIPHLLKKLQVGNDQEKAQSENDSHAIKSRWEKSKITIRYMYLYHENIS